MHTIELKHEPNARIDWPIANLIAARLTHQHSATAAIAFGTDNFCSDEAQATTQKIAKAQKAITAANFTALTIDVQHKMIAGAHSNNGRSILLKL
jgi:hypothetical protein